MKYCLLLLWICFLGNAKSPFVGMIREKVTLIDKTGRNPKVTKIDTLYLSGDRTRAIYADDLRKEFIYDSKSNYGFMKDSLSNQFTRLDMGARPKEGVASMEIYENVDTLLGFACDALVVQGNGFTSIYLYSPGTLPVSPNLYANYHLGYKSIVFEKMGVYPLKVLLETETRKTQYEVISIVEQPVTIKVPKEFNVEKVKP